MPRFLVKKDTLICHIGKTFKEGEIAEFDLPMIDTGKVDEDGNAVRVPMGIGKNLQLLAEEPEEKAASKRSK